MFNFVKRFFRKRIGVGDSVIFYKDGIVLSGVVTRSFGPTRDDILEIAFSHTQLYPVNYRRRKDVQIKS